MRFAQQLRAGWTHGLDASEGRRDRGRARRMTIHLTIERDQAAGYHKSSRFRCALHAHGKRIFVSTRNAGSVTLAKREADPVVRARAEVELSQ